MANLIELVEDVCVAVARVVGEYLGLARSARKSLDQHAFKHRRDRDDAFVGLWRPLEIAVDSRCAPHSGLASDSMRIKA